MEDGRSGHEGRRGAMHRELGVDARALPCVKQMVGSCCIAGARHCKSRAMLCNGLDAWHRAQGEPNREGLYVCIELILCCIAETYIML